MKRVLLDESVPRQLAPRLRERSVDAHTFPQEWRGASNGRLLSLAEGAGFDVLVTADTNMHHQQNLQGRSLALVVIATNRRATVLADVERIVEAIHRSGPGTLAIFSRP